MIDKHELRVGNWVKTMSEDIPYIQIKYGEEIDYCAVYNELIPLTEEILPKLNFEQEYKSEWSIKYTLISDSRFGFDYNKNFGWRVRYIGEHFDHIKSLHQLMNFYYSLTGKELNYSPINLL